MRYCICKRCVIDTTVPGVEFDNTGECNFCKLHDKLSRLFPLNDKGEEKLQKITRSIKAKAKFNRYDCIVGISGGRDSIYMLYFIRKKLGLRPLAVHFNDGFGNPVAGENMKKAVKILDVDLRTITSDWRESKDLKIAFLKASTPDLEEATDLGIAAALYGVAVKENIRHIIIGQSFRTEGIAPLEWNYLDGRYLKSVHQRFGSVELRSWSPDNPGFNLSLTQLFYYTVIRRIKTIPILYYVNYIRSEAEKILINELGWVYPGAHYYDDLYQSLMSYIYRIKFNIDRRKFNYSALVRSGQLTREEALKRINEVGAIEDKKVIALCLKRLGISYDEFNKYLKEEPKTFRDYPTSYAYIRLLKPFIKLLSTLNVIPLVTYSKYFECG
ncbi:MAG: N-acetyl sugar amidotransferase [Candidatus Omnitrophota bacterium]|nr:N-acetyl sugar amidotransferase [Candidatus Omnitrophota bacterium]